MQHLYDWRDSVQPEADCYWYHPDHLGSSSWITDAHGHAVQHLHYLPWGEDFVDQRSTNWNAMYTFSAKEKDTETGYSYFGSRYYSSELSIWLSVDPQASKYPSLSPYTYCANNPVKVVDPNGDSIINGYKEAYLYFLNQYTNAQKKLDAFGNDKTADGYNEAKIEYDRAAETYNEVSFLYKTVEVARSNVEKYNEELYNQMNSIENGSNSVDIRLYIDYSIGRYGNHRIPKQTNCPSSINVFLNPNAKFDESMDMGKVLSHELGHLLYIIPNWSFSVPLSLDSFSSFLK